jgi:transaldolase
MTMNDPLSAIDAAGVSIWLDDLSRERLVSGSLADLITRRRVATRPLWASTSTKDPAYNDTRYMVDLIEPGVVITMPEASLRAVEDDGNVPEDSVRSNYADAERVLARVRGAGVDYDTLAAALEDEGAAIFETAREALRNQLSARLSPSLAKAP